MKRFWSVWRRVPACLTTPTLAKVNVRVRIGMGALAREIGGERVEVFTATTGLQDVPHPGAAEPDARARSVDLLVCSGADLEIDGCRWSCSRRKSQHPARASAIGGGELFSRTGNSEAVDRSMGDVHRAATRTCTGIRTTSRREQSVR